MSNIKNGDRVRIKESGVVGTVISREQKALGDKRVQVEFVVKTGNGFESYKAFTRKEIEKIPTVSKPKAEEKTYPRVYNYPHKCKDGRNLVITGVVDTYNEWSPIKFGTIKKKYLTVGYAICHPSDDKDNKIGAEIALARAYNKPLAYLETPFTGEFREDFVGTILQAKANFVEENIERFINRDKK